MPSPEKSIDTVRADLKLAKQIDNLGIETVICDLDDTARYTHKEFDNGMRNAAGVLLFGKSEWNKYWVSPDTSQYQEAEKLANKLILPCVIAFRDEFQVTPEIMQFATQTTAKLMGLDEQNRKDDRLKIDAALYEVEKIYYPLEDVTIENAPEVIDAIRRTGTPTILATHGAKDYTDRKLNASPKLKDKFTRIICFQTHRPKSEQWEEQSDKVGILIPNSLIIGDNYEADILPTINRGAKAIWINAKGKTISAEAQKMIDDGKLRVTDSIANVIDVIVNW